jgi:hypothetical protein
MIGFGCSFVHEQPNASPQAGWGPYSSAMVQHNRMPGAQAGLGCALQPGAIAPAYSHTRNLHLHNQHKASDPQTDTRHTPRSPGSQRGRPQRRARAGPGPCSGPPGAHRPRRHPRRCRRRTSPACAHAREHCAASATVILYHVITPFSCIFHISYARVANETSYRWGVCVTLEHLPCAVVAFALDLF